ncbi:hypothetical protein BCR34DRAFT_604095 [Clohesyomyces aquaticus]|uniref:Uncharacterized protein n=1 Tax=Clohesyomyces aquaticus TaxID=1231657 RepID=A0A1Y1Z988_9PLEO|nr:hypothetical protein BCR34DRAFT_604095 [Clohesyomyces aquaticus]
MSEALEDLGNQLRQQMVQYRLATDEANRLGQAMEAEELGLRQRLHDLENRREAMLSKEWRSHTAIETLAMEYSKVSNKASSQRVCLAMQDQLPAEIRRTISAYLVLPAQVTVEWYTGGKHLMFYNGPRETRSRVFDKDPRSGQCLEHKRHIYNPEYVGSETAREMAVCYYEQMTFVLNDPNAVKYFLTTDRFKLGLCPADIVQHVMRDLKATSTPGVYSQKPGDPHIKIISIAVGAGQKQNDIVAWSEKDDNRILGALIRLMDSLKNKRARLDINLNTHGIDGVKKAVAVLAVHLDDMVKTGYRIKFSVTIRPNVSRRLGDPPPTLKLASTGSSGFVLSSILKEKRLAYVESWEHLDIFK